MFEGILNCMLKNLEKTISFNSMKSIHLKEVENRVEENDENVEKEITIRAFDVGIILVVAGFCSNFYQGKKESEFGAN